MDDWVFGYRTDFHVSCLYPRAGQNDKAFELLKKSFRQRQWAMPQLQVYPQLNPIRDYLRFKELVDRIERTYPSRYLRYQSQKQMLQLSVVGK